MLTFETQVHLSFVENSPVLICGHPRFENPYQNRFLEVEPLSEIVRIFDDGTLICDKLLVKRVIDLDELRRLETQFSQRCDYFDPKRHDF